MKKTILAVDDDADALDLTRRILEKAGYEVILVSDGEKALAIVDQHEIDIIVTDEAMPNVTGTALLRILRQRGKTMPIILVGGYVDESLKAMGFAEVFQKPVSWKRVISAINAILAEQG